MTSPRRHSDPLVLRTHSGCIDNSAPVKPQRRHSIIEPLSGIDHETNAIDFGELPLDSQVSADCHPLPPMHSRTDTDAAQCQKAVHRIPDLPRSARDPRAHCDPSSFLDVDDFSDLPFARTRQRLRARTTGSTLTVNPHPPRVKTTVNPRIPTPQSIHLRLHEDVTTQTFAVSAGGRPVLPFARPPSPIRPLTPDDMFRPLPSQLYPLGTPARSAEEVEAENASRRGWSSPPASGPSSLLLPLSPSDSATSISCSSFSQELDTPSMAQLELGGSDSDSASHPSSTLVASPAVHTEDGDSPNRHPQFLMRRSAIHTEGTNDQLKSRQTSSETISGRSQSTEHTVKPGRDGDPSTR